MGGEHSSDGGYTREIASAEDSPDEYPYLHDDLTAIDNKTISTPNENCPKSIYSVIRMCASMDITCDTNTAIEALKAHRGRGDPEAAVCWLTTEGGFDTLSRLKNSSQKASSDFIPSSDTQISNSKKIDILEKLAKENGMNTVIAHEAMRRCSSVDAAFIWMLENQNTTFPPIDSNITPMETDAPCVTSELLEQPRGGWTCPKCTFINLDPESACICGERSIFHEQIVKYQDNLSLLKMEILRIEQENRNLSEIESEQEMQIEQLSTMASALAPPEYWDPFPTGQTYTEVEIIDAKGPGRLERDRVINYFTDGGVRPNKIISLKRIQNLKMWQRFAAQCDLIAMKPSNKGNSNVKYLFHGPRNNTDAILKNGFVGQYGKSSPYGTWTHESSAYSGGSFADVNAPGGGRRIFICQAAIGTPGRDNGSGRCPNELMPGVLADCHKNGEIHVFYNDSQLYAEYLIHWK